MLELVFKVFLSLVLPLFMILLLGAWTVIPEGENEKFSTTGKILSSILWFLVAGVCSIGFVGVFATVLDNFSLCETVISECLFQKPEILIINGRYFVITFITYGIGCCMGYLAKKYIREKEAVIN